MTWTGLRSWAMLSAALALGGSVLQPGSALAAERTSPTAPREAVFYRSAAIKQRLAGAALEKVLASLSGTDAAREFRVRLLKSPGACTGRQHASELWRRRIGENIDVGLRRLSEPGRYYFRATVDFGGLTVKNLDTGEIAMAWYECAQDRSYALFADAGLRHFLLKEDGEPLWGWSTAAEK